MKRQILSGLGIVFSALGLIAAGAEARPVTIFIEAEVDSVGDSGNYLEGKINPTNPQRQILHQRTGWVSTNIYRHPTE